MECSRKRFSEHFHFDGLLENLTSPSQPTSSNVFSCSECRWLHKLSLSHDWQIRPSTTTLPWEPLRLVCRWWFIGDITRKSIRNQRRLASVSSRDFRQLGIFSVLESLGCFDCVKSSAFKSLAFTCSPKKYNCRSKKVKTILDVTMTNLITASLVCLALASSSSSSQVPSARNRPKGRFFSRTSSNSIFVRKFSPIGVS